MKVIPAEVESPLNVRQPIVHIHLTYSTRNAALKPKDIATIKNELAKLEPGFDLVAVRTLGPSGEADLVVSPANIGVLSNEIVEFVDSVRGEFGVVNCSLSSAGPAPLVFFLGSQLTHGRFPNLVTFEMKNGVREYEVAFCGCERCIIWHQKLWYNTARWGVDDSMDLFPV